jgi:hypothetical protein
MNSPNGQSNLIDKCSVVSGIKVRCNLQAYLILNKNPHRKEKKEI